MKDRGEEGTQHASLAFLEVTIADSFLGEEILWDTDGKRESFMSRLAPLVGDPAEIERLCSPQTLGRLTEHWHRVLDLGFELELGSETLQIRHRNTDFETVIPLGGPDGTESRRRLLEQLKRAFGGFRGRLSWLIRPARP
jgi:hypothetical protein